MDELEAYGVVFETNRNSCFDTVCIKVQESGFSSADFLLAEFHKIGINIRKIDNDHVSLTFDEVTTLFDLDQVIEVFANIKRGTMSNDYVSFDSYEGRKYTKYPDNLARTSIYMDMPQFRQKFSETNMMRYIQRLAEKDVSLTNSMIPLGSCTMKLNSAVAMIPVTWNGFANMHPFAPADQTQGYQAMFKEIEDNLCSITHYDGISMQPNSGATGEYTGLMAIKKYH